MGLVIIAVLCIPVMLFAKPIILYRRHKIQSNMLLAWHIVCAHCFVRYCFMCPSYSILRGRRLHDEVGSARFPLAAHGLPMSTSFDRRCWHNCGCIHPCVPRCSQQSHEVVWHTQGTSRYVEVCRRGVGLADTLVPGIVGRVCVFLEHVNGRVHHCCSTFPLWRIAREIWFEIAFFCCQIGRPDWANIDKRWLDTTSWKII